MNRSRLEDHELRFNITPEAALSNFTTLQQHDYNLTKLYNRDKRSTVSFGPEFKDFKNQIIYLTFTLDGSVSGRYLQT